MSLNYAWQDYITFTQQIYISRILRDLKRQGVPCLTFHDVKVNFFCSKDNPEQYAPLPAPLSRRARGQQSRQRESRRGELQNIRL